GRADGAAQAAVVLVLTEIRAAVAAEDLPCRTAAVAVGADLTLSTGPPTGAAVFRIGTEVQAGRLAQRQVARTGDVGDLEPGGVREINGSVRGVKRGIRGPVSGRLVD